MKMGWEVNTLADGSEFKDLEQAGKRRSDRLMHITLEKSIVQSPLHF